jgi:hypothetical protein
MTYTVKIDSLLPSLNEYVNNCRGNKYGANSVKQDTEHLICYYIIETFGADRPNIDQPVRIHFLWREANRKRDKDNVAFAKKFILDAFVRYGILSGDGWNVVDGFTDDFVLDKEDSGVTVTVEVIE